MKNIIYYLTALTFVCACFVSCSDAEVEGAQSLSVASFYPVIVMEGIEVTVTGTAMETVKEVVFPGGIATSEISVIDERTLTVIAPVGVSDVEAALIVKSESSEVASRQTMRKAAPTFLSYQYAEKDGAITGTSMTVNGKDLLLVEDITFALGDKIVTVKALDILRKSNSAIKLTIPQDAPIGNAVQVTLGFKNSTSMTLPEMEIQKGSSGGSWVPQEVDIYTGDPIAVGGWAKSVQIAASKLEDAKVEDMIRVYISDCESDAQGSLKNGNTWEGLTPELGYFDIASETSSTGYYERPVTEEILTQLKESGLIVAGKNYVIQKVVLITTIWVEGGDEDTVDPITPATIMLNDFEEHDGHNASWDSSWADATATEFPTDEKGNTYLHLVKSIADGWMVNCNHQDIGTVANIENYVIKFDVKIDAGVAGASAAEMQFVLADSWIWVGSGLLPETTDGKWVTVSRNLSDLKADLTGSLEIGKKTNGLAGKNIPQGVSVDNLRLDPKK